jgi:hypothetical protein
MLLPFLNEAFMATSDLQENISKNLTAEVDREFWAGATPDEREHYVAILKADGLGEAIKQVKKRAADEAKTGNAPD